MITLGIDESSRAISSTRLAEVFPAVRCPILSSIERRDRDDPPCPGCADEILQVRHHSLFGPQDFNVSHCFQGGRPKIEMGFAPRCVTWVMTTGQESPR